VSSSIAVEKLKQTCIAEWNLLVDYNNNKFIAEMANDSLPVQKFIFYLKQDHAFLKEFCSFLLRLSDAVEDPSLKRWLEGLHQAGVTKNYISFLRKISASTSIEEKVSAVVPCPWSYLQITLRMLTSCTENKIRNKVYQRWVEFYASQESHQQVEYLKGVLGQLYFNADKAMKLIMERSFSAACLQEYSFWKMAYNIEVTEPFTSNLAYSYENS
jgi:thiaminase